MRSADAKAGQSLAVLDFRKPQNGGSDRKRLIDARDRFVCNHLQLLQRVGAGATALARQARAWRAQVMRYIIADGCKGADESFHLIEHATDDHREFGEGIVSLLTWESFTRVVGDDALNPYVDPNDTSPGTRAQRHTDRNAKKHTGNQTKRQRPTTRVIAPTSSTFRQANVARSGEPPVSPTTFVYPVDHSALHRIVGLEIGWEAFQVSRDLAAV